MIHTHIGAHLLPTCEKSIARLDFNLTVAADLSVVYREPVTYDERTNAGACAIACALAFVSKRPNFITGVINLPAGTHDLPVDCKPNVSKRRTQIQLHAMKLLPAQNAQSHNLFRSDSCARAECSRYSDMLISCAD